MNNINPTHEKLVLECQGLVRFLAVQIHQRMPFVELDDLMSCGQLGLVQAAKDYDPNQGAKFSTFAYYRIRGAIYDGATRMQWFRQSRPRVKAEQKYEQLANEVLQVEAEETPDDADPAREASWLGRVTRSLAVVYLASQQGSERDDGPTVENLPDSIRQSPLLTALRHEAAQKLGELIQSLPADSASLIRAVYFEGLTLQEASERIGMSKGWASRLHSRALEQLARGLRMVGIDGES